jgi:hypothetical protein
MILLTLLFRRPFLERKILSEDKGVATPTIVNPTDAEIAELPPGTPLTIEGVFVRETIAPGRRLIGSERDKFFERFHGNPEEYGEVWEHTRHLRIKVADREITVMTLREQEYEHRITYDDGVLENLQGEEPRTGETIRIAAVVSDKHRLNAEWNRPYLVVPDQERAERYERLRDEMQRMLSELESYIANRDYARARAAFAELRYCKITREENKASIELMRRVPVVYRSVYDSADEPAGISRHFRAELEGRTKWESMVYAGEFLRRVSADDLSGLLAFIKREPFTAADHYDLALIALWASVTRPDYVTPENDPARFEVYATRFKTAVDELRGNNSPRLVEDITELIDYCVEKGHDEQHVLRSLLEGLGS